MFLYQEDQINSSFKKQLNFVKNNIEHKILEEHKYIKYKNKTQKI